MTRPLARPHATTTQVLPQTLTHLQLDDEQATAPDFDCLAVYTCSRSCSLESLSASCDTAYAEEFVWVQPPSV